MESYGDSSAAAGARPGGELRLTTRLTPQGRLLLDQADDAPPLDAGLAGRLRQAFGRGAGHGLLRLGAAEAGRHLPPVLAYWRPPRPKVTATVGGKALAGLGADALLDFRLELTLEGEPLTQAEMSMLLAAAGGLVLLRGMWVEIDRERLGQVLDRLRQAEQLAGEHGLTFAEAMRLLAGAGIGREDPAAGADPEWSAVVAGPWLAETLRGLRSPEGLALLEVGPELRATLRPYQQVGVRWLNLLTRLGLGACLADDMGLGKTIQVLALLLVQRRALPAGGARQPSLLVAPASLLANWAAEIERFAPGLRVLVAHPSALDGAELRSLPPGRVEGHDLVITSYGSLLRLPWLAARAWQLLILDEAQAIKNPEAKQTRAAKRLEARARVALTGTPVENRLGDLWSIFDFLNAGLLGSAREFGSYAKGLAERQGNPYGPLRELVRPYILRRLKTDRAVITDLPDKTEVKAWCGLSRKQAVLYGQAVEELAGELEGAEGIRRRGVVLAFLMRFKQICNHPSQWLGDGVWAEQDSGKWARLRELGEVIAARQEKVLVFTQFREVTGPLASFLSVVFGRPGLVLHGQTEVGAATDEVGAATAEARAARKPSTTGKAKSAASKPSATGKAKSAASKPSATGKAKSAASKIPATGEAPATGEKVVGKAPATSKASAREASASDEANALGKTASTGKAARCCHPGCRLARFVRGEGYCSIHWKMWSAGQIGAPGSHEPEPPRRR